MKENAVLKDNHSRNHEIKLNLNLLNYNVKSLKLIIIIHILLIWYYILFQYCLWIFGIYMMEVNKTIFEYVR